MSEALRALEDGNQLFEPEPDNTPESQVQDGEVSADDVAPQLVSEEPQAKQDKESGKKEVKQLSKFELQKQQKERDKRRADQAYAKLAEAERQREFILAENARLKAEREAAAEQAKIQANPFLREAVNLLGQGYRPKDLEAEAVLKQANGDTEGAEALRAMAIQMRNYRDTQAKTQEAQAAQQAVTSWRQFQFGQPEFDQAVGHLDLKKHPEEFDAAWGTVEQGIIDRMGRSRDPIDQEISKTFRNKNSEFGRRMVEFLETTAFGQAFKKHALGILPATDLVKQAMVIDRQGQLIEQLTQENNHLKGITSIGGSAPVGYNGTNGRSHLSPELSYEEFCKLPAEKMRERLRSNERN